MKKIASLCLCMIVLTGVLAGCSSSLKADESTVLVKKNGSISDLIVEKFDKDYYDAAELESFVTDEIDSFKAEHADASVEADSVTVEENIAKVSMKYGSYSDYASFNGVDFFAGTVVQAMAAGYKFDTDFYPVDESVSAENATEGQSSVTEGTVSDTAASAAVGKETILSDADYKVVVTEERIDVKVAGKILYVSDPTAVRTAKDTVQLPVDQTAAEGETTAVTYIIYK